MSSENATEDLRQTLREWAHGKIESGPGVNGSSFTRRACQAVLDHAGVPYTSEQLDRALVEFRRIPFRGGNYTLDAKRLLAAMS